MEIDDNVIIQLIENSAVNAANISGINKELGNMRLDINNEMGDMRGDVRDMLERTYDSKMGISNLKTKVAVYSTTVSLIITVLVSSVVGKI